MSPLKYSSIQVALHWLSAIIIIWALTSGFYVALVPVTDTIKEQVSFINVSLTTVLIPFFLWRTALAVSHCRRGERKLNPTQDAVARVAHAALYGLSLLVLLTGVLMMDRPIDVFGVVELPAPLSSPGLTGTMTTVHIAACVALGLLVGLHVAAVCKHELAGRRLLRRMSWRADR